jgi:uncharacterized protein YjbI with pentapeptide repeats
MKAKELLKHYREGRRDFRSQDLQGLSFQGKDLSGTDFSECDIRGTNFSKANLTGAKFVGAKAGLQDWWQMGLLDFFILLSILFGLCIYFLAYLTTLIFDGEYPHFIIGWISLLITFSLNFILSYRGFNAGAFAIAFGGPGAFAVAFAVAGTFVIFFSGAVAIGGAIARAIAIAFGGAVTFAGLVVIAFAVAFVVAVPFAVAFAVAIAIAGAFAVAVAGVIAVAGVGDRAFAFVVAFVVAFTGAREFAFTAARAWAGAVTIILILFYSYIGWRAIKGDSKYILIREIAVAFAATGGTTFNDATLTDADFTKATLKNTDFQKATLTRTCFRETKTLDLARPGNTYLKIREIQELVQTGQGQDKNFDYQNLQGLYLKEARLADASFIGANLNYANLNKADLSRAKLVQTQLEQTDFTGATLTGAYIEDWNITKSSKFNDVRCEYVYMRLPTKENPDPFRKPDNRDEVFADGDFDDFIKPIFDTLDLYHTQNIDPRAIAIALRNLAENNPDAKMEIKAMEKRGNNFLIRLATSPQVNRSQLSADYFKDYNENKALSERQQALLLEKDDRIKSYENMLSQALLKPTLYAENYHNQGDTMSDKSSDFKFGNVGGDVVGVAGGDISGVAGKDQTGVAGGDISGTVTATIGQLTKSEAPEAPKLAELLTQLQSAIASDTHLSEKDKVKALKQLQALAEAGQNPKDEEKKDLAHDAITMLKGIVTGLPGIAAAAKACQELLPLITSFFGL